MAEKYDNGSEGADMVPTNILANRPGGATIESSRSGGAAPESDEITHTLGVGLSPEQYKAFKKARDQYDNDEDRN